MSKYRIELDDGQLFEVEAEQEPTHDEVMQALGMGQPQGPLEVTDQSRAEALGSSFMRNLGGVIPAIVKGVGELSEMGVRNLNPVAWAAMAGVPGAQSLVDTYSKPGEFLSGTVAEGMQNKLEEMTPINPAFQDDFSQKAVGAVGQGTGQLASMLIPSKMLSLTPRVARAMGLGQAFSMGAASGAETAEDYGVTDPFQKMLMTYGGGAIEAGTEMIGGLGAKAPTEALLGALKSATRPGTAITRGLKTIGSEAIEEPIAGQLQDWLTTGVVDEDPNRPGFALNGTALPPDTLSMKNLYNRLEEGALGAVGGTVFAGAEALGSRTGVDEALSLRYQAQNTLNDLRSKENLTPQEQDILTQVEAEDQNLGNWLERQGFNSVRPALDQIIQNPDTDDSERSEAVSYAALIDNLQAVENAPEATPEEIQGAREAVSNHPLNRRENRWNKANQDLSIKGTIEDRMKALQQGVRDASRRQQGAQKLQFGQPLTETEAKDVVLGPIKPIIEQTAQQIAEVAPETAQVLQQIVNETPSTQDAQPLPQDTLPEQSTLPTPEPAQEALQPPPVPPAPTGPEGAQTGVADAGTSPVRPKPQLRQRVPLGISVSPREVQKAVKKFQRFGAMRLATVEELAQDPNLRGLFSDEASWENFVNNQLAYSEGLSQDGSGNAVVIPENLAIYNTDQERAARNGTTAGEEAIIRVMFHENWHGIERWIEHSGDPKAEELKERYYAILDEISEEELDDLAKRRYHHLSNWRNVPLDRRMLQSEVLAERRELAELTGEPDSLIEKFLAWLRDVFKTVTGSEQEPTPDELQELFNAWYRAQKSTQTRAGPVQESMTEIPPRPEVPVSYEDRGTGNTLDEVLDSLWRPFYSAWESRQQEVGKPLDQAQLAKDWSEHISDPDFLFDKDLDLRIQKKNAGRNWVDIEYAPRELTPPEIQSSLPELTPEQRQARLTEITDRLSYAPSQEQQEGQSPAQATKDQRKYATDGSLVEMYREGVTGAELDSLSTEALGHAIAQSPDGASEDFGKDLMKYLRGETPTLYGLPNNAFLKTAIALNLEHSPMQRAQLGIDGGDLRNLIQQGLSQAGRTLQAASHGRLYQALKELNERGQELTDKEAEKEIGTKDFKSISDQGNKEIVKEVCEAAEDLMPNMPVILEAAQNAADEVNYFELGMEGMDPKLATKITELNQRIERLGQLKAMRAKLVAGQQGPAASLPELPQNLTLAELDKLIAEEDAAIKKLVDEVDKAQKKASAKPREKKPKKEKIHDNASFSDYANGKETAGLPLFVDLVKKYVQANSFNRGAFVTALANKFNEADPVFIQGVVNRIAVALNGAATEEGVEDDLKKPNLDARAKRIVTRSVALQGQPEEEAKFDAFKDLTIQRLKEEIDAETYQKKLQGMGIEAETAFAMNRKVEEDTAKRKAASEQRRLNAEAKKEAAKAQREAEQYAKRTEATIAQLAKEFSDTLNFQKPKDIDAYKALLNNYIGTKGPPISEEQFIEGAKALNIPEQGYTRLMGVLDMQRKRATAVADAKNRQKEAERLAKEAQKEAEKHTKEAEAKISALAKEFSDTLPAKSKEKDLTELQRLIGDYTGRNGPVISEEMFEQRAQALNIPEGVLERLRGVLQMQRKRESMVADVKARQKEAERLQKELEKNEREALGVIDKLATEFSDTLSQKAKQAASDLKLLSNSFLGKEGPPITEEEFLDRAAALNLKPATAQKLLKVLSESRRRDAAVRYAKAVQKAQEAKEKAVQSMVKKLGKVKNPTPQKLKQRSKFVNLLQEGMNSGILDSDLVRAAFAQAYDLHGLTPERLKSMADLMNEIDRLPDGMVKETLFLQWNQILNDIAPASSFSGMAFSAYMGYVLQGAGTMLMQTSNLANFLTPLAFVHSFGKIYTTTQGTPLKKLFTALNIRRNWNMFVAGAKESRGNMALIRAGLSGIKTSTGQGLGVTPIELTQTPYETSLAWTPWGQISQFRLKPHKLMEQMGVMKLVRATRLPAWVASRSFQAIRGAEGWSGGVEKNMAFRTIALEELQKQGKSYDQAWEMVEDALNEKTNAQMWKEAYEEADKNITAGTVNKSARKQRATELVQDMLDEKWNLILANRHRQQSAIANFKTDPITPVGELIYRGVSAALKYQHWGPFPNPLRFGFLFPRFFINSMEQAYMYSPVGMLLSLGINKDLPESKQKQYHQRVIQIYGSLENYKNQRAGKGLTGTALLTGIGAMMTAAMQMWDPDDDEPPMFWMTGDVIGRYDRRGILSETGWWAPNTMYIMGMKFNYVNASPQFGMILNAAGNIGDRFMFPELLGTKYNARTKEYEESFAEQWIRPVGEATAAPMSRSTYRVFYDALDNAMGGDFKKLTRLATQPATGTATALTLGVIPSLKTFEKVEKSNIQPRSPQDIPQTLQAGVPFANSMGLDTGKPLYSVFGTPLTPYSFLTVISSPQEGTPEKRKAADILIDLGVSKQPPKMEYLGDSVVELAVDGKTYLLPPEDRDQIIEEMGSELARKIVSEKSTLEKLANTKGRDAVSDRVGAMGVEIRKKVLQRHRVKGQK